MTTTPTSIFRELERRRYDVTRINSMGVKLHDYTHKMLVVGTGEITWDILFPVMFTEEPAVYFGHVLDSSTTLVSGAYPTITPVVATWNQITKQGQGVGFFYKGATIAAIITGVAGQTIWIHSTFLGKAMRNPLTRDNGAL